MKLKKTKYVVKCIECKGTGLRKPTASWPNGLVCEICLGKGTLPVFEEVDVEE